MSPCCAVRWPMPPPSVRPATPVEPTTPPGVTSPNACVAASKSSHVAPPWARAIRAPASTSTPPHLREIDHEAAVENAVAGGVVSSAAHRDLQLVGAREVERGRDVGRPETARDDGRTPVDERVEAAPRGVVTLVLGRDHRARKRLAELAHGLVRRVRHAHPPLLDATDPGTARSLGNSSRQACPNPAGLRVGRPLYLRRGVVLGCRHDGDLLPTRLRRAAARPQRDEVPARRVRRGRGVPGVLPVPAVSLAAVGVVDRPGARVPRCPAHPRRRTRRCDGGPAGRAARRLPAAPPPPLHLASRRDAGRARALGSRALRAPPPGRHRPLRPRDLARRRLRQRPPAEPRVPRDLPRVSPARCARSGARRTGSSPTAACRCGSRSAVSSTGTR